MMRSLYSGVTGLRNHQTRMDVIGNNIANVNTVGFKSSRTVFQDLYSQTLSVGSKSTYVAGTPSTGSGGTNPKQIGLGVTLSAIDVMHTPGANQYTGGTMDVAINDDGFFVIDNHGTTVYTRAGNFYEDDKHYLVTASGGFVLCYPTDTTTTPGTTLPDKTSSPTPLLLDQKYTNYAITENGLITAYDPTTETTVDIAFIAMATFPNTNGLQKVGGNYYMQTASSGTPKPGTAGDGYNGSLSPGSLEMSNVDLSAEFVDLIVTQRGFQANSRVITTSDTMLEELINLKR